MGWRIVMERIISKALQGFLSLCLIAGLAPAIALADTTVSVGTEKTPQIVQDVKLEGLSEEGTTDAATIPEAVNEATSEMQSEDKASVPNKNKQPSQVTAEIALATPDTMQLETVLTDGLIYSLNNENLTASLTGWYGKAPAGDLVLSPEVVSSGKHYTLDSLGGGSFHR